MVALPSFLTSQTDLAFSRQKDTRRTGFVESCSKCSPCFATAITWDMVDTVCRLCYSFAIRESEDIFGFICVFILLFFGHSLLTLLFFRILSGLNWVHIYF